MTNRLLVSSLQMADIYRQNAPNFCQENCVIMG